jgi:hypothetical protein
MSSRALPICAPLPSCSLAIIGADDLVYDTIAQTFGAANGLLPGLTSSFKCSPGIVTSTVFTAHYLPYRWTLIQ